MFPSKLAFASFLSYAPRGDTAEQRESREWVNNLKNDRLVGLNHLPMSTLIPRRIVENPGGVDWNDYFKGKAVLVPIPRHGLIEKDTLWVPKRLALELVNHGLGGEVAELLVRVKAVQKSSIAQGKDRPTPTIHYESLKVSSSLFPPEIIILVDDVVTRGSSFLAGAARIQEAFPNAKITAFAAMRTVSDPTQFVAIHDPRIGLITMNSGSPHREP